MEAAQQALSRAGENRPQLEQALRESPDSQRFAMEFLIANMPDRDLRALTADYLLANQRLSFEAWREAPWKEQVDEDTFLNFVLPYANINEGREAWREDFRRRCLPLVADAKTPTEAAVMLNRQLFPLLKVRYSTQRRRADQAPAESIRSGLASCTGLSILLIDACRAVGVPARFVGVPLWSDNSGNHSWVEVWDRGWHFTGAAEPQDALDRAWFTGRAAQAKRDDPQRAIYAARFQRTPTTFPLVWDRAIDYVFAVNVTDRYTSQAPPLPVGHVELMVRVIDSQGERLAAQLEVTDASGNSLARGSTKDERFDRNDHFHVTVKDGARVRLLATRDGKSLQREVKAASNLVTLNWSESMPVAAPASLSASDALAELREALAKSMPLGEVRAAGWASVPLDRKSADLASELLAADHARRIRETRAEEMKRRVVEAGELKMPFFYKVFGERPAKGRGLYISMHGGGGAPPRVNDAQWQNQQRLYELEEGVYLAPRAPTNTWDLWHQGHIDGMFRRLIENLIVFEGVDPNRVYLMGYSAGGDGVFQLAPRMADSFAAAAMMAGHPNETSPLGLRNLPFTLHMGGRDAAYQRNAVAAKWEQLLGDLRKQDPGGYEHWVKIYPDKGHWMDREDAAAIPWMAKHTRQRYPRQVVWRQDDVTHSRFYWLALDGPEVKPRAELRASWEGQACRLQPGDARSIRLRLHDQLVNLDQPVQVSAGDRVVFAGTAQRTIATLAKTLEERGDPSYMFPAELAIQLPAAPAPEGKE
ncbi:MAG: dienelactone hydrolase family protein [Planctomycetales bacterium]|nr:dienelactone hydrolase family protein [Planctomycetales bacterium]